MNACIGTLAPGQSGCFRISVLRRCSSVSFRAIMLSTIFVSPKWLISWDRVCHRRIPRRPFRVMDLMVFKIIDFVQSPSVWRKSSYKLLILFLPEYRSYIHVCPRKAAITKCKHGTVLRPIECRLDLGGVLRPR